MGTMMLPLIMIRTGFEMARIRIFRVRVKVKRRSLLRIQMVTVLPTITELVRVGAKVESIEVDITQELGLDIDTEVPQMVLVMEPVQTATVRDRKEIKGMRKG